jgi:LPPG:FO 2-phospho-L-lactate transferase
MARTHGPASGPVVVLAGGTGGAKLARGMLDLVGDELVVIANTGDDVEIYGSYVSPDPDLVTFWLADRIDERGWGLAGDTFHAMAQLRELGVDVWFNLGDRDLAICLQRARMLRDGAGQTAAQAAIARALGVRATVLPMSDEPVRTAVLAAGRWWPLQEFMIRHGGAGPVHDVEFRHAGAARPTAAVLDAIGRARTIVIGPSNPVISIGPILAVPGIAAAIAASAAAVVAVSPLVGGRVLKGPTAACLTWAGRPLDSDGIAACYDGLLDGLVADAATVAAPTLTTEVLLDTAARRRSVAEQTLAFAASLTDCAGA